MTVRRLLSLCALVAVVVAGARAAAASETLYRKFKVSLGYHFSSGTYGTSATTEIGYVPLIARAEIGRWTVQGTIPYLRISGPRTQGPNGPIPGTTGTNEEADGLGDILGRVAYTLLPQMGWIPFTDIIGVVKFPTASRDAGLGTGEFDVGVESEVAWVVGNLTPFASLGYRYLGSPPGAHLDNTVLASVGAMYRVLETLRAGLLLDYRQAASASSGERLELVPFASWKVTPRWSVDGYVSAGLAKGSPDVGVGVQLGYVLSTTNPE